MTLRHYKQIVKDNILINDNPQTWRIKQWIQDESINVKRLLKDMERENLITINFVTEPSGKVRRVLKNKMNIE